MQAELAYAYICLHATLPSSKFNIKKEALLHIRMSPH